MEMSKHAGELRSVFRYPQTTRTDRYVIYKYEPSDHTHPRCVVAALPLWEAQLYVRTVLAK